MVISLFRLFLDTRPQISSDRRPQLPFSSTSNFWTCVLSCFQQKTTTSIFLYFACFRFCLLKFSALLLLAEASSIPMTRSEQKNKRSSLSNTTAEIKFNRRKKYKEMLPAQKDKLLLQRRTRDLESARRSLQVPLVIREPCVTSTKVRVLKLGISNGLFDFKNQLAYCKDYQRWDDKDDILVQHRLYWRITQLRQFADGKCNLLPLVPLYKVII